MERNNNFHNSNSPLLDEKLDNENRTQPENYSYSTIIKASNIGDIEQKSIGQDYQKLKKKLNIAVVGCLHGNIQDVYNELIMIEKQTQKNIDLLLCCGDFESVRNEYDLKFKSCPEKYKHLGQFVNFSKNPNKSAPFMTIFIGGNHEASNVLNDNFYGGWVAPKIYYLGRAGVINYKGLRIAGISGIYNKFDYCRGHFEVDLIQNIKSIFHVREYEIAKMAQIKSKIDILMTHDWPGGVVNRSDINKITKIKYHWKDELKTNTLGSPASEYLMKLLKPRYLLSGHMHFTYFNEIRHNESEVTKFIALDKAGTKRKRYYLHVFEIESEADTQESSVSDIKIDPEWVAITQVMNEYMPLEDKNYDFSNFMPCDYVNYQETRIIKEFPFRVKHNYTKITPKENLQDLQQQIIHTIQQLNPPYVINYIPNDSRDYSQQRSNMIKTFQIEDIHKSKGKKLKNSEELIISNFDFEEFL
jgi:lariat debranching enzyme